MSSWLQPLTDCQNFLNIWKWEHISFIDWKFSWIGSSHSASYVLRESEFMVESAISLLSSLVRASSLNVQMKQHLRSLLSPKEIYVTKILYTCKGFFRIFRLIEILQIFTSTFVEPENWDTNSPSEMFWCLVILQSAKALMLSKKWSCNVFSWIQWRLGSWVELKQ